MSRGLGSAQRRVLALLDEPDGVDIGRIAERLGVNRRRAATLARSLRDRGLVQLRYQATFGGWPVIMIVSPVESPPRHQAR